MGVQHLLLVVALASAAYLKPNLQVFRQQQAVASPPCTPLSRSASPPHPFLPQPSPARSAKKKLLLFRTCSVDLGMSAMDGEVAAVAPPLGKKV